MVFLKKLENWKKKKNGISHGLIRQIAWSKESLNTDNKYVYNLHFDLYNNSCVWGKQ